jgi:predicted RNA polymerase sigma factor
MRSDIADQTFFDELFRENYGKITGALIRKFGPDRLDLIESSIQEAFLKAIQLWPNKGFPDQPLNWLIRVASNFALDNLRRQAQPMGQKKSCRRELSSWLLRWGMANSSLPRDCRRNFLEGGRSCRR